MNSTLEKAREALSFDEIKEWLFSKSGNYKSEYIQASIVMLREMFSEKQAIDAIDAEKPSDNDARRHLVVHLSKELSASLAMKAREHYKEFIDNSGLLEREKAKYTVLLMNKYMDITEPSIQQFAIEYHERECGKCKP
jgi:hypothetical protein